MYGANCRELHQSEENDCTSAGKRDAGVHDGRVRPGRNSSRRTEGRWAYNEHSGITPQTSIATEKAVSRKRYAY